MQAMLLLIPVLLAVGYTDLKYMRIPNILTQYALALFVVLALLTPMDDLGWRLVVAGSVFALGLTAFAFGFLGGGDVKFLSALMLFVPTAQLSIFANTFSLMLLAGIALVLAIRLVPAAAGWGWKGLAGKGTFPMGISIAFTGLIFPWAAMLSQ